MLDFTPRRYLRPEQPETDADRDWIILRRLEACLIATGAGGIVTGAVEVVLRLAGAGH